MLNNLLDNSEDQKEEVEIGIDNKPANKDFTKVKKQRNDSRGLTNPLMGDNMTRHSITATEPKMVTQELEYDSKDGLLLPTDKVIEMTDMDTPSEQKEYQCTCGETFNTLPQAEEHMEEVQEE